MSWTQTGVPMVIDRGRGRDRILTADKDVTLLNIDIHYIWIIIIISEINFCHVWGHIGLAYWPKTHLCAASWNCMLCDYNSILQCNFLKDIYNSLFEKIHCIVHQKKNLHKQWFLWYRVLSIVKIKKIKNYINQNTALLVQTRIINF